VENLHLELQPPRMDPVLNRWLDRRGCRYLLQTVSRWWGEMAERRTTEQFLKEPICTAADALERVPDGPGFYAIYVDDPFSLPNPFRDILIKRQTKLIYIGIATKSLRKRLVKEDLLHERPSSFFRSIGAILKYRPSPGSLAAMKRQNNYRFSKTDTEDIRSWTRRHLLVNWKDSKANKVAERSWIAEYCPIINMTHNLEPIRELEELRRECRHIARGRARL
jgi:hypothetical protein